MGRRMSRAARRTWLITLLGIVLVVVVDRLYVFTVSHYAVNEQADYKNKTAQDKKYLQSPMLSVIEDVEGFIQAHEKLLIVVATLAIAWFTATLWRATAGLYAIGRNQAKNMHSSLNIARESADAAKSSADAAIKAEMPILFPLITDATRLFPVGPERPHTPKLTVMLENYGQTPAIIIQLKCELLFTHEFPAPQPWEHPDVREDRDVVPGETRYQPGTLARITPYKFHRAITDDEIAASRRDPTPEFPNPPRFLFYGEIIYDDVFGYRHIKGFGRKVFPSRDMPPPQAVRGGDAYEYYRRINRKTGREE